MVCQNILSAEKSIKNLVSVYTPNLTSQDGIFLRITRKQLGLKVLVAKQDLDHAVNMAETHMEGLDTESFCVKAPGRENESLDDTCDVYLGKEIPGLSFVYF